jgi:hypothetical protein
VKKWRYTLTANVLGRSVDDDAIAICGPPGCLVLITVDYKTWSRREGWAIGTLTRLVSCRDVVVHGLMALCRARWFHPCCFLCSWKTRKGRWHSQGFQDRSCKQCHPSVRIGKVNPPVSVRNKIGRDRKLYRLK